MGLPPKSSGLIGSSIINYPLRGTFMETTILNHHSIELQSPSISHFNQVDRKDTKLLSRPEKYATPTGQFGRLG